MKYRLIITLSLTLTLLLAAALPAAAHQPFFEEQDTTAAAPWFIKDPAISTVVYATLQSPTDVDYYAFDGQAGQRILLEITIPQIIGQDDFAPTLALIGPGLAAASLPDRVARAAGSGALILQPDPGPAKTFFEPFSRTSYWERQSARMTLPESGRYIVAVWHSAGQMGRYGFVIGDKERLGGDLLGLATKLADYWTPYQPPADLARAQAADETGHMHSPETLKDHSHDEERPPAANPFGHKPVHRWPEGIRCSTPW